MRVLQLRYDNVQLDLHPLVTVVTGLDPDLHERVLETLEHLAAGREPQLSGLIEAHGVLLELSTHTLELLELRTDLDVVVRAEDLPGGAAGPALRALQEAESVLAEVQARADAARAAVDRLGSARTRIEEAIEAARRASADPDGGEASGDERDHPGVAQLRAELERLGAQRSDLERQLLSAQATYGAAEQALVRAQDAVDEARRDRRSAAELGTMAAGRLESARGGRDPFAAAAVESARERLADIEREVEQEAVAEERARERVAVVHRDLQGEEAREIVDRLEAKRPELEAALFALDAIDPYPVRSALDVLREDEPTELVPSPEANALADRWLALKVQLSEPEPSVGSGPSAAATARARLDRARSELFEAEQAVKLPELDRTDIDELERAHAAVLDAQERADGRLGGSRAQKRMQAAREAEWLVLDRLGFTTYADFMMGTSILHVDAATERRLDDARRELADAEDAWQAIQDSVDAELQWASLLDRRRVLRDEARALLGRDPGDDVEWALREHRVSVKATSDRAERLRQALVGAGMALGDEQLSEAQLIELAELWLTEEGDTGPRLQLLRTELAALDTELAEALQVLRDQAADSGEDRDEIEASERRAARLHEAQAALAAAEARSTRHAQAEAEIAQCQAQLEEATELEQQAALAVAAADESLEAATDVERAAAAEMAAVQAELAEVAAAEQAVLDDLRSVEEGLEARGGGSNEEELAELDRRVEQERMLERTAEAEMSQIEAELAVARERADLARAALGPDAPPPGTAASAGNGASAASADEVEWYLLARLASQRSVSYAGSMPLVLDHALRDLAETEAVRVLERLERMAASVQVVVLADDGPVTAWARSLGGERAAVIRPTSGGHVGGASASTAVPSEAP